MAKLVTDIGNQKLLVATPLQPVTIKSIAIGSGTGSFNSTITKLKTEVWRGDATAPIKNSDGELEISAIIPANVGGWTMTEWGWFDVEGDLIAYGQFDNTIYKAVGTMTIQPDLSLALTGSVEADIIVTDSINWEHNKMTGRNVADAHPISSITGLSGNLNQINLNIADRDKQNVKITGNQTIDGFKSFNGNIGVETIKNGAGQVMLDSEGAAISASIGNKNVSVSLDPSGNTVNVTGILTVETSQSETKDSFLALEPNRVAISTNSASVIAEGSEVRINGRAIAVGPKWNILGWDQTQQNVIGSRSLGQDYKNLTGRPIEVRVVAEGNSSSNPLIIRVGAAEIIRLNNSTVLSNTFTVQSGESYSVSGAVLHSWSELR